MTFEIGCPLCGSVPARISKTPCLACRVDLMQEGQPTFDQGFENYERSKDMKHQAICDRSAACLPPKRGELKPRLAHLRVFYGFNRTIQTLGKLSEEEFMNRKLAFLGGLSLTEMSEKNWNVCLGWMKEYKMQPDYVKPDYLKPYEEKEK